MNSDQIIRTMVYSRGGTGLMVGGPYIPNDVQEQIKGLKAELEDVKGRHKRATDRLAEVMPKVRDFPKQLRDARINASIVATSAKLAAAEAGRRADGQTIETLRKTLATANEATEHYKDMLGKSRKTADDLFKKTIVLRGENEELQKTVNGLRMDGKFYRDIEEKHKQKIQALNDEIHRLLTRPVVSEATYKPEVDRLNAKVADLRDAKDELLRLINEKTDEIRGLKSRIAMTEDKKREITELYDIRGRKIADLEADVDTLGRDVRKRNEEIASLKKEIELVRKANDNHYAKRIELGETIDALKKANDGLSDMYEQRASDNKKLSDDNKALTFENSALRKEVAQLKEVNELIKSYDKDHWNRRYELARTSDIQRHEIKALNDRLLAAEKGREEAQQQVQQHVSVIDPLRQNIAEQQVLIDGLRAQLASRNSIINEDSKTIKYLTNDAENQRDRAERFDSLLRQKFTDLWTGAYMSVKVNGEKGSEMMSDYLHRWFDDYRTINPSIERIQEMCRGMKIAEGKTYTNRIFEITDNQ